MSPTLPLQELRDTVRRMPDLWDAVRDTTLLFTGGTGFVGAWMIELLAMAALEYGFTVRVINAGRRLPHTRWIDSLAMRGLHLEPIRADVLNPLPSDCDAAAMVHAATDASLKLNLEDPQVMLDTIVTGTRNALAWAEAAHVKQFLFLSSGAVYGTGLPGVPKSECSMIGPDPFGAASAYAEGKRLAEQLCTSAGRTGRIHQVSIARCFAFTGPLLPIETHFAVGNFIRDKLLGRPIEIRGDGTAVRSYLYAADMALWLWTILLRGATCRPYNVGSARPVTIRELASIISRRFGGTEQVNIAVQSTAPKPDFYVPDVRRAKEELGLDMWTPLEESIDRTIAWHQSGDAERFSTVL